MQLLFSCTISPEAPWLLLPVHNRGKKVVVTIKCGGSIVKSFDMKLANGVPADWYAPTELSEWSALSLDVSINDDASYIVDFRCAAQPWPRDVYQEALRPQIHFSPARGWTNDPNGLVFYKGEFHLFYQHNPYGTEWGNMTWGHAVSPNLLHWTELPDAIHPDRLGTMFSGSAVVDIHNTSQLGTAGNPPLVLIYTAAGNPFTQCLAFSTDGRHFTKYAGNPVVPNQDNANRDPKVYWHEPTQRWIMLFYVGHANNVHTVEFWSSPNLREWTRLSVLPGDSNGGHFLYECPDFFELPIEGTSEKRWVVIAANAEYAVGSFDGTTFTPEAEHLQGTQGSSYAAQTYYNMPDGRRVMIAWLRASAPVMPFNQCMSIPHELGLVKTSDGILLTRRPIAELHSLRSGQVFTNQPSRGCPIDDCSVDACELHIAAKTAATFSFTFKQIEFAFDPDKQKLAIGSQTYDWPLASDKLFSCIMYIDRTAIEIFAPDGLTYIAHAAVTTPGNANIKAPENLEIIVYPLESALFN